MLQFIALTPTARWALSLPRHLGAAVLAWWAERPTSPPTGAS